jgi:N-acetylneuraminic acid mutarotase
MTSHRVFLSHTKEDQEAAARVCALLEADGIGCWLASRDARTNKDKAAASIEAIRSSDLVLLIFSASANSSPYVLREIERAIAYERPVLSIHLDDAVPNPSLEYYLNLWQWLDASGGFEDRHEEIVAVVRGQLTGASEPAKASEQAAVSSRETTEEPEPNPATESVSPPRLRRRTWVILLTALLLIAAAGLGLGFGLQRHHSTWTELGPWRALPAGRDSQSVAYDSSKGLMMMFGGRNSAGLLYDDTWAYDPTANSWAELNPSGTAPPPRAGASMAYDPAAKRLILFGGHDGEVFRNDTWAYDPAGNIWTEIKPSGTLPPERTAHAMAYDPVTRRMIMFGGEYAQGSEGESLGLNDTWAYDPASNTWTELRPSGTLPPARASYAMAYDSSEGLMIVFGGTHIPHDFNDTWAYDPTANSWTELKPSGTLPEGRNGLSMAYDSSSDRVVMFGGFSGGTSGARGLLGDTWEYDSVTNTWAEIRPVGEAPAARQYLSLVYCPSAGRVVMFGGATPKAALNDTWAYTP